MSPESPTDDHLRDGPAPEVEDRTDNIQPPHEKVKHRRRHARIPALSLVVALVFFFGPAIAFTFGDRAAPIENRPLAVMPSLSSGWQAIPKLNAWAVDHLPLRSQAVQADTDLSEAILGEPPPSGSHTTSGIGSVAAGNASPDSSGAGPSSSAAPRVIQGKDDWLYLAADFSLACNPKLSLPAAIDGLKRLHTAIEASGRKLVISIVPDKSTAVPQNLPESFAFKNCSEKPRREFWQDMATSKVPFVDLRQPLAEAERATGNPSYLKLNTHWNMQGAAVWTESVLAALDRRLIEGMAIPGVGGGAHSSESSFVAGPVIDVRGDLTLMLGVPREEPMTKIVLRRNGVTLSSNGADLPGNVPPPIDARAGGIPVTTEASTTGAPLYPGHTLILGDSFYNFFGGLLFAPFMSKLTGDYVAGDPAEITRSIIDADTVVIELVERSIYTARWALIQPDALAELERSLAAHHR